MWWRQFQRNGTKNLKAEPQWWRCLSGEACSQRGINLAEGKNPSSCLPPTCQKEAEQKYAKGRRQQGEEEQRHGRYSEAGMERGSVKGMEGVEGAEAET